MSLQGIIAPGVILPALALLVVATLVAVLHVQIAHLSVYVASIYQRAGDNKPLSPAERSFLKLTKSIGYTVAGAIVLNLHVITDALGSGKPIDWQMLGSQVLVALLVSSGLAWDKYKTAQGDPALGMAGMAVANDLANSINAGANGAHLALVNPVDMIALKDSIMADLEKWAGPDAPAIPSPIAPANTPVSVPVVTSNASGNSADVPATTPA